MIKGRFRTLISSAVITLLLVLSLMASVRQTGLANPQTHTDSSLPLQEDISTSDPLSISNETCLECHGQPGLTLTLENGELLDLYVPPKEYTDSTHGQQGYACVQCHREVGDYPHPAFSAIDQRDVTLQLNETCATCHAPQVELSQDSVHALALASGKREAATCTDCHGAHNVQQLTDLTTGELLTESHIFIPKTCANCHNAIYEKYQTSVHGAALIDENNPDVPTCIDCHGVHNIENPTTAAFRLNSPQMCAKCHTDAQRMSKYGLSTQVLDTYVADFHGSTVNIFEKVSPDAETNKPVCYDCHGVHDISNTDNPQTGISLQQNLLIRCQVCHPTATANFPSAWLSHYIPSTENNPLVYYVDLFYKIFIPVVLGGMMFMVVLDAGHSLRKKYGKNIRKSTDHPLPPPPDIVVPTTVDQQVDETQPISVEEQPVAEAQPVQTKPSGVELPSEVADEPPTEPSQDGFTGEEVDHG